MSSELSSCTYRASQGMGTSPLEEPLCLLSARTRSERLESQRDLARSLKEISAFTREICGCSTSNVAAYIAFLCASSPETVGSARAMER